VLAHQSIFSNPSDKISVVSPKGTCYKPWGRLQSFPAATLPCQRTVARPINTNITFT